MCSLPIVMSGLGTLFNMAGIYQQGQAQKQAAAYNAQVAENERVVQEQMAQNEIAKGAAERNRHLRAGTQKMGELRSLIGASGFTMDSGSNLDLLAQSAQEIQYDANIISQNAAMNAWQHQVGAARAANQRDWAMYEGKDKSYRWGMAGSLLGGIAEGMDKYSKKNNKR